jgi:hypothetical protein
VLKRSQGGSDWDLDLLLALCPRCHAQTDAPFVKGRLMISPVEIVYRFAALFARRRNDTRLLSAGSARNF